MVPDAEVGTRSLVKLTRAEIDEIKAAGRTGLVESHLNSGYVYYVDDGNQGIAWHGFYGTANNGVEQPYVVCSVHNQLSFEQMQGTQNGGFGDGGYLPGEGNVGNGGWGTGGDVGGGNSGWGESGNIVGGWGGNTGIIIPGGNVG